MKINRVLLSCTDNPLYLEGLPLVVKAWRNMGLKVTVILVGDHFRKKPFFGGSGVDMVYQRSIDGIPDENLSKVARVMYAGDYPGDWCLISDVDMLPLNPEYFSSRSELAEEDKILYYTKELTGEDAGKFPACYMLAKGMTFRRGMFPTYEAYKGKEEYLKQFRYDNNGDITKLPFSDESLYAALFRAIPKVKLDRYHQDQRLCRSNWIVNQEKLDKKEYIDCHMPRPYSRHELDLKPVLKSIGLL